MCHRVLARIIFRRAKTCRYNNDSRLGEIFLVKCQQHAFSFNKGEAKVYCYAFMHVFHLGPMLCEQEEKFKKNNFSGNWMMK
jgi:hypothetical protein